MLPRAAGSRKEPSMMRTLRWAGLPALAVCLVFLTAARAADDKPQPKDAKDAKDTKELDAAIRKSTFEVINYGREFFNRGQQERCIIIYDTALMTVEPLLAHQPKVQKFIRDGREAAMRGQNPEDVAFALRAVLDDVRDALKPG